MSDEEIFDKLIFCMKKIFKNKKIDYELINFDTNVVKDIGFDSMNLIMMSLMIEEQFHIDISELTVSSFTTIKNVIDYINQRLSKK